MQTMLRNKPTQLFGEIREFIYREGVRLNHNLTEEKLASHFNVSRTPIREAIKHLKEEGIIERKRGRGISLRIFKAKEIEEIYDVRTALENLAVKSAAVRITKKDMEQLEHYAKNYDEERKKGNLRGFLLMDQLFHEKILEVCGNSYLYNLMKKISMINTALYFYPSYYYPLEDPNPYTHKKIIEALRTKDFVKCGKTIEKHIQWSKNEILELMEKSESAYSKTSIRLNGNKKAKR